MAADPAGGDKTGAGVCVGAGGARALPAVHLAAPLPDRQPRPCVVPELFAALQEWEQRFRVVDYVTKGSNIWTEHYSAIQADVPDPADPSTQINTALIGTLMKADIVAVAGEAGSHCLANTVRDIADNFGDDRPGLQIVLLQDATSPVGGFGPFQDKFLAEMTARGMQLSTTREFLA